MTLKQPLVALTVAMLVFVIAKADSAKLVNPNNGHSYQRFDAIKTWDDAKIACAGLGAHLATITSQMENDWLVLGNFFVAPDTYLGGTDALKNGQWTWVTGEAFNYKNWDPGEPNGSLATDINLTMAIRSYYQPGWNNVNGITDAYPYLCEWESGQYLDVTAISDVNGDGVMDQTVLALMSGKYYLRIINGASGKQLKSLSLGSATTGVTLSGLTVMPDINGDSAADFALLVLSGDKYYLRVVDGVTGNQLRQVSLGAATGLTPIALTVVDDANANTYKDISILIKNADGTNVLQIRDGLMLSILKTFKLK